MSFQKWDMFSSSPGIDRRNKSVTDWQERCRREANLLHFRYAKLHRHSVSEVLVDNKSKFTNAYIFSASKSLYWFCSRAIDRGSRRSLKPSVEGEAQISDHG